MEPLAVVAWVLTTIGFTLFGVATVAHQLGKLSETWYTHFFAPTIYVIVSVVALIVAFETQSIIAASLLAIGFTLFGVATVAHEAGKLSETWYTHFFAPASFFIIFLMAIIAVI